MSTQKFLAGLVICTAIGTALSISTLFIPISVPNHQAAKRVEMGWPATFIHQDLSDYEPFSWPQKFRINAPQEHATTVHIGWLGFDIAFFSILAGTFAFALRRIRRLI